MEINEAIKEIRARQANSSEDHLDEALQTLIQAVKKNPTSKEVDDDINRKDGVYPNSYDEMAEFSCKIDTHVPTENGENCECGYFVKKVIQAVNPKEEVGVEEIAKVIADKCHEIKAEWWEKDAEVYAKSLLTIFSIRRRR